MSGAVISSSVAPQEPVADIVADEPEATEADDVFFHDFKNLADKALTVLCWYYSDPTDDLALENAGEESYRKVGRFGTIAELKTATEEIFTKEFCNARFYAHAFTDAILDKPMYTEIDGELYRNVDKGGFGWPYQLTGRYTVSLETDDLIVLLAEVTVIDYEEWFTFVLKKENDTWKLEKYYDYTPYAEYEEKIEPAVSAWLCSRNWEGTSNITLNAILTFYKNQYLSNITAEEFDAVKGYSVPASEVVSGLEKHFNGVSLERLKQVNDEKFTSALYDEPTDSFIFDISFDPATFVICGADTWGDNALLRVLVLAKNDKASYWGNLLVKREGDSLRYLSNTSAVIETE